MKPVPRHFIRAWRKFRGLTQAQLAHRVGLDVTYVSKIESGNRRFDETFLHAAADALQCTLADLIMRDPADPEGIWSIWDGLAASQRRQIIEIAKTFGRTGTDG